MVRRDPPPRRPGSGPQEPQRTLNTPILIRVTSTPGRCDVTAFARLGWNTCLDRTSASARETPGQTIIGPKSSSRGLRSGGGHREAGLPTKKRWVRPDRSTGCRVGLRGAMKPSFLPGSVRDLAGSHSSRVFTCSWPSVPAHRPTVHTDGMVIPFFASTCCASALGSPRRAQAVPKS